MPSTPQTPFTCKVHDSVDENNRPAVTIYCHGRLVSAYTADFRGIVQPLVARGGRILLDFSDLEYLDSSGLGAVVGLKVSSMNRSDCSLELINLTPRVKQLLSMTNLMQIFTVKNYPGAGPAFAFHEAAITHKHEKE
jgi:anti-sigma B factor antagonist